MKNDEQTIPTPEMLAAYVDGELEPRDRLAVEHWLTGHADARADVEAQRRLARAWDETRPGEPDEGAWTAALAVIRANIQADLPFRQRRRLPLGWLAGLAAAIVAAIVLILANRTPPPGPTRQPDQELVESSYPVVNAEEVEITSLADADADDLLLVGYAPVREPLLLVDDGEIHLEEMTPEPGMNPRFHGDPGMPPMIVPAAPEPK